MYYLQSFFSHSVTCFFLLLIVFFKEQKSNFGVYLLVSYSVDCALDVPYKISLLDKKPECFRSFVVLGFTFRYVMHFGFICGVRYASQCCHFLHMDVQ